VPIAPAGQQPWRQAFARSRQAYKEGGVGLVAKEALDLLVVGRDLLDDGEELGDQRLSEARLHSGRHQIGAQVWLVETGEDPLRCHTRAGKPRQRPQEGRQLLHRRRLGDIQGGIGWDRVG
jgi:hypothetical protein